MGSIRRRLRLELAELGSALPSTALRLLRLTGAATGAYLLADSVRRILSVLAGVAVALVFSRFVGFSWWSLALLIAASILIGGLLRLGPHLLEVPISAMLVLSVSSSAGTAADARISETLVGAAVGILVNVLFPPALQAQTAGAAVEAFANELAGLLDRVARDLQRRVTVED